MYERSHPDLLVDQYIDEANASVVVNGFTENKQFSIDAIQQAGCSHHSVADVINRVHVPRSGSSYGLSYTLGSFVFS